MDERMHTLIIGSGQAGLAVGHALSERGLSFLIVDANPRVGDAWRNRWDSLRLFTPNFFNSLPGMRIPGPRWGFPTKDEFADYLERYAQRFELPVRGATRIDRLGVENGGYVAHAGENRFFADNVVVAMSSLQRPRVPEFASELDRSIVQLHAGAYKGPQQLADGAVLIVGAGNSGAEIAMDVAGSHRVHLSGDHPGVLPFRPQTVAGRLLMPIVGRVLFHRVLTTSTPIGRKARPKMIANGDPLIRIKPKDLARAGVERVPRTTGVHDGRPTLADGRHLDVANVIWCTGFHPGFSWIEVPVVGPVEPEHRRGVVESHPGLYFVGLNFLYAKSSEQIHGVGRDAAYIADHIAATRATQKGTPVG